MTGVGWNASEIFLVPGAVKRGLKPSQSDKFQSTISNKILVLLLGHTT